MTAPRVWSTPPRGGEHPTTTLIRHLCIPIDVALWLNEVRALRPTHCVHAATRRVNKDDSPAAAPSPVLAEDGGGDGNGGEEFQTDVYLSRAASSALLSGHLAYYAVHNEAILQGVSLLQGSSKATQQGAASSSHEKNPKSSGVVTSFEDERYQRKLLQMLRSRHQPGAVDAAGVVFSDGNFGISMPHGRSLAASAASSVADVLASVSAARASRAVDGPLVSRRPSTRLSTVTVPDSAAASISPGKQAASSSTSSSHDVSVGELLNQSLHTVSPVPATANSVSARPIAALPRRTVSAGVAEAATRAVVIGRVPPSGTAADDAAARLFAGMLPLPEPSVAPVLECAAGHPKFLSLTAQGASHDPCGSPAASSGAQADRTLTHAAARDERLHAAVSNWRRVADLLVASGFAARADADRLADVVGLFLQTAPAVPSPSGSPPRAIEPSADGSPEGRRGERVTGASPPREEWELLRLRHNVDRVARAQRQTEEGLTRASGFSAAHADPDRDAPVVSALRAIHALVMCSRTRHAHAREAISRRVLSPFDAAAGSPLSVAGSVAARMQAAGAPVMGQTMQGDNALQAAGTLGGILSPIPSIDASQLSCGFGGVAGATNPFAVSVRGKHAPHAQKQSSALSGGNPFDKSARSQRLHRSQSDDAACAMVPVIPADVAPAQPSVVPPTTTVTPTMEVAAPAGPARDVSAPTSTAASGGDAVASYGFSPVNSPTQPGGRRRLQFEESRNTVHTVDTDTGREAPQAESDTRGSDDALSPTRENGGKYGPPPSAPSAAVADPPRLGLSQSASGRLLLPPQDAQARLARLRSDARLLATTPGTRGLMPAAAVAGPTGQVVAPEPRKRGTPTHTSTGCKPRNPKNGGPDTSFADMVDLFTDGTVPSKIGDRLCAPAVDVTAAVDAQLARTPVGKEARASVAQTVTPASHTAAGSGSASSAGKLFEGPASALLVHSQSAVDTLITRPLGLVSAGLEGLLPLPFGLPDTAARSAHSAAASATGSAGVGLAAVHTAPQLIGSSPSPARLVNRNNSVAAPGGHPAAVPNTYTTDFAATDALTAVDHDSVDGYTEVEWVSADAAVAVVDPSEFGELLLPSDMDGPAAGDALGALTDAAADFLAHSASAASSPIASAGSPSAYRRRFAAGSRGASVEPEAPHVPSDVVDLLEAMRNNLAATAERQHSRSPAPVKHRAVGSRAKGPVESDATSVPDPNGPSAAQRARLLADAGIFSGVANASASGTRVSVSGVELRPLAGSWSGPARKLRTSPMEDVRRVTGGVRLAPLDLGGPSTRRPVHTPPPPPASSTYLDHSTIPSHSRGWRVPGSALHPSAFSRFDYDYGAGGAAPAAPHHPLLRGASPPLVAQHPQYFHPHAFPVAAVGLPQGVRPPRVIPPSSWDDAGPAAWGDETYQQPYSHDGNEGGYYHHRARLLAPDVSRVPARVGHAKATQVPAPLARALRAEAHLHHYFAMAAPSHHHHHQRPRQPHEQERFGVHVVLPPMRPVQ